MMRGERERSLISQSFTVLDLPPMYSPSISDAAAVGLPERFSYVFFFFFCIFLFILFSSFSSFLPFCPLPFPHYLNKANFTAQMFQGVPVCSNSQPNWPHAPFQKIEEYLMHHILAFCKLPYWSCIISVSTAMHHESYQICRQCVEGIKILSLCQM